MMGTAGPAPLEKLRDAMRDALDALDRDPRNPAGRAAWKKRQSTITWLFTRRMRSGVGLNRLTISRRSRRSENVPKSPTEHTRPFRHRVARPATRPS